MQKRFRLLPALRCLAAAVMLLAAPAPAQEMPDLTLLPVLASPGTLTAEALPDQGFWLDVTAAGLYRLALDGPGMIGLTAFQTATGRSGGSEPQERLLADGSASEVGALDEVLLQPGFAYLMQIAAVAPRGVHLDLIQPLDPAQATALPPPETPLVLEPGQAVLLAVEGTTDLTATSPGALRLEALFPPGAAASAHLEGRPITPGGVFPLAGLDAHPMQIDTRPRLDGSFPLMILRAMPTDLTLYDEVEPVSTILGPLPAAGREIRGVLLAERDDDAYEFTLDQTAAHDLFVQVAANTPAFLSLRRDGLEILRADMAEGQLYRPALILSPGAYLLEIIGRPTRPRDYLIALTPAAGPAEGEPDDHPETARPLEPGQALRGTLGQDNPGHVRFAVPVPGHLWELRGVQGLRDLLLTDGNGATIGSWQAQAGALALRLALPPGTYTAQLRGDGPYALRLSDLGPLPEGAEAEPNDSEDTAIRLKAGDSVTGDFQTLADRDFYELNLAAPTPLEITVTGLDDGASVVDLFLSDTAMLRAELARGQAPLRYSAMFPAGRHLIEWRARDEGVSGRYTMQIERIAQPEPFEPGGYAAMPGDGVLAGHLGGFDAEDRIFVPLPEGSGHLALSCQGALQTWEVMTFGDETRLMRGDAGDSLVLPYTPDLGGAVCLAITTDPRAAPGPYDCRLRFAGAEPALAAITHDEAADEAEPSPLPPGTTITGSFDTDRDRDHLRLDLAEGAFAGLLCDAPVEQLRADVPLRRALEGLPLPDGSHPFRAGAEPLVLEINPPATGTFPQNWSCSLLPETHFATPAQMGPTAPFTGFRAPEAEPTPFDPAATLQLLSGGRPDWLTPTQVTDDLDVALSLTGLDTPFRAYGRAGQRADLTLTATNPGDTALALTLDLTALADGWRLIPAAAELALEPGGMASLTVTLELPPMQSPIPDPQIRVVARADAQTAALTVPIPLDPTAAERGAHRFWTAPDSLRGGLNPMLWQHGARLIALDGEPQDEEIATRYAFLHDGAALHTGIPAWLRAKTATFQLAETAPIAGFFVHLRSTEPRRTWPGQLGLELSPDGTTWANAGTFTLTASDLPQLFPLDQTPARFARITLHGCRTDPACDAIALSDMVLVAAPEWRLSAPVDLADPLLGGHVVWAQALGGSEAEEDIFGGQWNGDLLEQRHPTVLAPAREDRGDRVQAVIGFHAARAGRISAVEWIGHADDITRTEGALVEVSVTGPAGPWQPAGTLPAPPMGGLSARLDLPTPLWARAVRLTFQRDANDPRALPDRIRIWEDPSTPPLLGLWEDDRPDAGYEATVAPTPPLAPAPQGGPDAAGAVNLPLNQPVTSSVQLERNTDWWRIDLPEGPPRLLSLRFAGAAQPEFTARLTGPDGTDLPLSRQTEAGDLILTTPAGAGTYLLTIEEPPRSVAILWDTSGSVASFVPGILEAVRLWSQSLQPGRDRLQLLPFGLQEMLLPDWAGTPEEIYPALGALPYQDSSDSESAMGIAAAALAGQDGQRGIVVLTDAETSPGRRVWGPLLQAEPRVVALSIDSSTPQSVAIMQDWASLNRGYFARVTGNAGLADGLDLAAALFRAPKGYTLTATAAELVEPTGTGSLYLRPLPAAPDAPPKGGIEVILDASGSMLQRMPDGQRRIAVAHEALAGLVQTTLPPGTPFAFRAFGLAPDACDSRLIVPLGPLDPASAEAAIRDVPAVNLAKTAIAASLALAAEDLAALDPPRVVVLVTDGEETCDGDVAAEIARLNAAGLDLRLTIVGFAIDDAALSASFAGWARAGGGQYLPAGDSAALDSAISESIAPRFAVDRLFVDGQVAEVALAGLDQDIPLPAGRYRLRPLQTAQGGAVEIDVSDGTVTALTYDPANGLAKE